MHNSEALDGVGALVHLGKSLDMTREEAVENYVKSIKTVVEKTDGLKSVVILDNTAGQGTEIGYTFEELAHIYKKIGNKRRVKFGLDTAHMFAAGYDIKDPKNVKKVLSSRVDRHEDIGYGAIGDDGLKHFALGLKDLGGENIPLILETPRGFESYEGQIKKVKSWF